MAGADDDFAAEERHRSRELRPVVIYEFASAHLSGFLKGERFPPGVEIATGHNGRPVSPPGSSLLTPTHYLSNAVVGDRAPLEAPGRTATTRGESLLVTIPADEQWPVEAALLYRPCEGDHVDLGVRLRFSQPVRGFEMQFLSQLSPENGLSSVRLEDRWFRPGLRAGQVCFFVRDPDAGAVVMDGRWDFLAARGAQVILDERGYDLPLLVQQDESGWALIHMLITDECPSICLSAAPPCQAFSLGGRSAEPGDEMTFHARLLYGHLPDLDAALPLYYQFVRDVRAGQLATP